MQGESDRFKVFTRRAALLGGGKLLLGAALIGRMYYLQVIESKKYRVLAEENRISLRLLPPPRGRIVDRFGTPLAVNQQNFRVLVVREDTKDVNATLDALARIVPVSDHDRSRVLREIKRKRSFVPVTVRENLTWEEMAKIQVNAPDLPGVIIDEGLSRNYPLRENGAHVMGYVSAVSEKELQKTNDPLLELPGFRIGKAGVERIYDLALRGKGGTSQVEVNALGRVIKELERKEGQPGVELALTLDMRIQRFAAERLGEESGAVTVMDVHTGEILALVSNPSYDPNAFNRGLTTEEWKGLTTNPRAPLINKPIAGQYAPGSTFKMMTAIAALESGVITPDQQVYCPGYMEFGNQRFHCWKEQGHGHVDMVGSLKHSCDVYYYEIAKRVGIDRIAEVAKRFGMGDQLGIDLPGERSGLIPTKKWKRAALGQSWHQGETLIAGIGQGYVLTTPLQLAVMTARIANGGLAVTPRLTRDAVIENQLQPRATQELERIGVSRSALSIVQQGMTEVVNGIGGTAWRSQVNVDGQKMAGKTGTAQVRRISQRERDAGGRQNNELPWEERDNALFVAYAPLDNPRYAISVVVEHGGSGSRAAGPVARDVMRKVLELDPASISREPMAMNGPEKDA